MWTYNEPAVWLEYVHDVAEVFRRAGLYTALVTACLLYTSDAADDLLCVDLGGRRIIKKNNATTARSQL